MKFEIEQQELLSLLGAVRPASESKADLPAYLCTQVIAREDCIELNAFSLNLSMSARASTPVIETGVVGVATKSFYEIIKVVEGTLTLELRPNDNRLYIRGARSEFQVNTIAGDSFPIPPNFNSIVWQSVPGTVFEDIDSVMFATLKDPESRPQLSGVYMGSDSVNIPGASKEQTYMVGCDGHRIAIKPHNLNFPKDTIIPADSLKKVSGVLSKEEDVSLATGENEIYFSQANVFAAVRLLSGSYPAYQKIVPQKAYDEISISKDEFLSALKKVTPMFDQGYTVTMTASNENIGPGGNIKFQTRCAELGEAECFLEGQVAKDFKSAFNAHYMEQAVNKLESDIVTLRVRDEQTPIEIREGDYIHVVMPKRIGS